LAQVRSEADHLARFGCPIGSLSTELGKTGTSLQSPAARPLLELEDYLRSQFGRVMTAGAARECAEHLLALLQGAGVVAHARRDPSVVQRQVDAASVWLDNVLAQAARLQGNTSRSDA
jgi:TetR/AcrR family transcriptional regulator, transcriptional repressor for nem operon